MQGSLLALEGEALTQLKLKQGRPHLLLDMRITDDAGRELPWDGRAFGNLQVRMHAPEGAARLALPCSAVPARTCSLPLPLQVRGPHTLSKYYNSDAVAADADGWFDTGDVATIDRLGHMQVRVPSLVFTRSAQLLNPWQAGAPGLACPPPACLTAPCRGTRMCFAAGARQQSWQLHKSLPQHARRSWTAARMSSRAAGSG